MMRTLTVLAALLLALPACDKEDPLGCAGDTECPSGHVCLSSHCSQLCATDTECVVGNICSDGLCEQGSRSAPQIHAVLGNGSASCPQATAGTCFGDGLVVQGANLLGAAFRLESTTGGSTFDLHLGSQQTNDRVEVDLPLDLLADDYTLVAMNAAGAAQGSVSILQGEPSNMSGQDIVDRINTEATGRFQIEQMAPANDLISHINGGTLKFSADVLPPASGGTNYTGEDIVGLINSNSTTPIDAGHLATGDTLMQRINGGSTALAAARLPAGNDLISRINSGSTLISSSILPAASGGGPSTGNEVVTLLNDGGTTDIGIARLPVGNSGSQVAYGNHSHTGSDLVSAINSGTGTIDSTHLDLPVTSLHVSRSTATPVLVNDASLMALCGDADGCDVRVGFKGNYGGSAIVYGPPCRVHIASNRQWAVSGSCLQTFAVYDWEADNGSLTWLQPYSSNNAGLDGADTEPSSTGTGCGTGGCVVLRYFDHSPTTPVDACDFSDATRTGTDNSNGFYFWMTSAYSGGGSGRTCELHIED